MKVKAKILNERLIVEIEDLPLIPEKVELYGSSEYATYFLEAAWTDVVKDANLIRERLKQFGLDDLVDGLTEFGFDSFQLHVKNYAVMHEVTFTAIRSGVKGNISEMAKIGEKISRHKFCEITHFETHKDKTQVTITCEVKTV
jgi:hypothetical protein